MKKVRDLETYYFQCDCSSQEHTMGVTFDLDNKEMTFSLQLNKSVGLLGRLWLAIKYVLGQHKYLHWEETIMDENKSMDFYNLLNRFVITANFTNVGAKKIQKGIQNRDINKLLKPGTDKVNK